MRDTTPLRTRLVEVIAQKATGSAVYGSGCIVRGRTVLTAAHVVAGATAVRVRGSDKRELECDLGTLLIGHPSDHKLGPDLALIDMQRYIDSPVDPVCALPTTKYGRVSRDEAGTNSVMGCSAIGYPEFAIRSEDDGSWRVRDTIQADGTIPSGSYLVSGFLNLQVNTLPAGHALPREDVTLADSEWAGMSGAPVFAGDVLLGAVCEHAWRAGAGSLTVTPLTAIGATTVASDRRPGDMEPERWWERLGATLDSLTLLPIQATSVTASISDVLAYLQARIGDWDAPQWRGDLRPSMVERPLCTQPQTGENSPRTTRLTVVVGGPGSGKTWLAHRYARESASKALSDLEAGIALQDVELPLFTTWSKWSNQSTGSTRESLVAAAFSSGLGGSDLGVDITQRLKRTYAEARRVWVIVDSLDEAADPACRERLRELSDLDWRVTVTSRQQAWDEASRSLAAHEPGHSVFTVVTVPPLVYPDDVEAYVTTWYVERPERGQELLAQFRERPQLQQTATIPLLLTYFCLVAEDPKHEEAVLPGRSRGLYRSLCRRLLRGGWSGVGQNVNFASCETQLAMWAWEAVEDSTLHPSELGMWADTFVQASPPPADLATALERIAPTVEVDEEGVVTRRFVHRTLLEHFVAEHVATLCTEDAAHVLLPHLWFDPDWNEAATAAAIVAHNADNGMTGALLERLLDEPSLTAIRSEAASAVQRAARRELDGLFLKLAERSEPCEWSTEHQVLIRDARLRQAVTEPESCAASAHWGEPNEAIRTSLLSAVRAGTAAVDPALAVLTRLDPTSSELAIAWQLAGEADPAEALGAIAALTRTPCSKTELAARRTFLIRAISRMDPDYITWHLELVEALRRVSDDTLSEAREELSAAMTGARPRVVASLARAVSLLDPPPDQREVIRSVLLGSLQTENRELGLLIRTAVELTRNEDERSRLRTGLITARAWAPGEWSELFTGLRLLVETDRERTALWTELRDHWGEIRALFDSPESRGRDQVAFSSLVILLRPSQASRTLLRDSIAACVADSVWVGGADVLVEELVGPDLEVQEWSATRDVLLALLPFASSTKTVAAVLRLDPTEDDLRAVRGVLLSKLESVDRPFAFDDSVAAILATNPSEQDRDRTAALVVDAIRAAREDDVIGRPTASLLRLNPTSQELRDVREVAKARIAAHADTADAFRALALLSATTDDQRETRAIALGALTEASPDRFADAVEILLDLSANDADWRTIRDATRRTLENASPDADVRELLACLRVASSPLSWLEWLEGSC